MAPAEKSSRKERERHRHRQEILSKALRLFAEKGFHDVSMQEIAAAVEFATGTLYNFFSSKEDLFFELLDATTEESLGTVLSALDGPGDERHRLSLFIHLHTRVVREHGAAFRLYLMESQGRCLPGPRVEAYKKEIDRRIVAQLSGVIAAGIDKGLFHSIDPVIAARCLFASLEPFILAAIENPQAVDLDADLKKIEAVFFSGLLKPSGERRDK
ncbi:MAG: TetR/AcrR family transcriptional regulator [Phycisphaerae bacterium]|nr:TetR/AcrR family transcriptional regulator [Phycisphaerae bacterium]